MYKRKKGMTLIETVIYMGLLAVVMMIAGISFSYIRNKVYKVSVEEEVARVKIFLNKQLLDSSKTTKGKRIQLKQREISESKTKETIKLVYLTIDVKKLSSTAFEINQGKFSKNDFKIKLEDKNKGVHIIETCKNCEKIHH